MDGAGELVRGWTRAILLGRDRLQSRLLCWALLPVLAGACGVWFRVAGSRVGGMREALAVLALSALFALVVWGVRAATAMAAASGGMICFGVTLATMRGGSPLRSGLAPLMVLFLLTFVATRVGRWRRVEVSEAEERRGRRASQVVANLGVAALLGVGSLWSSLAGVSVAGGGYRSSVAAVLMLAALAEATADTVSSEIGQAFGRSAVMLTTMRRVPAGTDGGISLVGSAAGVLGAALVAGAGMWGMRLDGRQTLCGCAGGIAGLFFDSLLGATVEREGWLGNDLVNFCSTVFAVVSAWGLALIF